MRRHRAGTLPELFNRKNYQLMKMKTPLPLITSMAILLLIVGCRDQTVYRTKLGKNELFTENASVLVDGVPSGFVKALHIEGDDRVALLVLTDHDAQQKAKVGMLRIISEDGRVHLRTASVPPGTPSLSPTAFIPTQSQTECPLRKYATKQIFIIVGIVLATILILCFLVRSLFHVGLIMLCLALAALTAWIFHPYLTPHVERLYAASSTPKAEQADAGHAPRSENRVSTPIKEWEAKIFPVLEHRPHPRVAAFAGIFVLAFIPYSILLGGAVRSLCRKD